MRGVKHAARAQLGPQRQQHIEHHAHAGDGLALKGAAGLVRVHDHVGIGQADLLIEQGWQMVVGDQHLQTQRPGARHALNAGNAVVHRHQHVGTAGFHAFCNRRGQAVTIDDAVGHQVADVPGTQQPQAAQRHGAGGGTVAVIVGDDADFFVAGHRIGQQTGGLLRAAQRGRRQQFGQSVVEFVGAVDAARRIKLRQQRVNAGLLQRPDAARRHVAYLNFHGLSLESVE